MLIDAPACFLLHCLWWISDRLSCCSGVSMVNLPRRGFQATWWMKKTANKDISLSLIKHDGVPQHQLSFTLEVVLPGNPNMHLDVTLDDFNGGHLSDIKKYYRPEFLRRCAIHMIHSLSTWQIYKFTTQRRQFCTSLHEESKIILVWKYCYSRKLNIIFCLFPYYRSKAWGSFGRWLCSSC